MSGEKHQQWFAVAAVVGIFLLSTGCNSEKGQAAWWQGEGERVELEQKLALKSYRFSQFAGDDFEAFQDLTAVARKTKESLETLHHRRRQLESEVTSCENQWPQFRETILRDHRHHLIGETFESLKSTTGREYKNVTVAQIDDAGVTFRHDAGSARLGIGELDAKQQLVFGLDADLAMVAETKERQEGAAYDQWIDKQLVAVKGAEERKSEAASEQQEASEWKRSQLVARQYATSRERPLAQGSSSVGYRFSRTYNSYPSYTPAYRYIYSNSSSYSGRPRFSESTSYVGGSRPNTAYRPAASPIQSYGGGSNCRSGGGIYSPRTTPDSPSITEP